MFLRLRLSCFFFLYAPFLSGRLDSAGDWSSGWTVPSELGSSVSVPAESAVDKVEEAREVDGGLAVGDEDAASWPLKSPVVFS